MSRRGAGTPRRGGTYTPGVRRTLRLAAGWLLVALGVAGLFLPLVQGVVLIAAGLLVLSRESERLHRIGVRLARRFPLLGRLRPDRWGGRPDQEPGSAGTSTGSPDEASTTDP